MGTDALAVVAAVGVEGRGVRVFDDFEFVLLVWVEEAVEGGGGEVKRFGD